MSINHLLHLIPKLAASGKSGFASCALRAPGQASSPGHPKKAPTPGRDTPYRGGYRLHRRPEVDGYLNTSLQETNSVAEPATATPGMP
jgi:hypothetical protein